MLTDDELKPCPFCGGEAELWDNKLENKLYCVICRECECMTPVSLTEERVVELWNRREPIDKVVEQLEEMKAKPMELKYDVPLVEAIIEIVKKGGNK